MASPSLDLFDTQIDALSINAANKNTIKARGATLYQGATQEEAAHVARHIDAEVTTGATGTDLALLQRLRLIVDSITTEASPHLATDVASLMVRASDPERAWAKAMGSLMTSKTMADATARFRTLLAEHDTPAMRTKLRALRDLITNELGA